MTSTVKPISGPFSTSQGSSAPASAYTARFISSLFNEIEKRLDETPLDEFENDLTTLRIALKTLKQRCLKNPNLLSHLPHDYEAPSEISALLQDIMSDPTWCEAHQNPLAECILKGDMAALRMQHAMHPDAIHLPVMGPNCPSLLAYCFSQNQMEMAAYLVERRIDLSVFNRNDSEQETGFLFEDFEKFKWFMNSLGERRNEISLPKLLEKALWNLSYKKKDALKFVEFLIQQGSEIDSGVFFCLGTGLFDSLPQESLRRLIMGSVWSRYEIRNLTKRAIESNHIALAKELIKKDGLTFERLILNQEDAILCFCLKHFRADLEKISKKLFPQKTFPLSIEYIAKIWAPKYSKTPEEMRDVIRLKQLMSLSAFKNLAGIEFDFLVNCYGYRRVLEVVEGILLEIPDGAKNDPFDEPFLLLLETLQDGPLFSRPPSIRLVGKTIPILDWKSPPSSEILQAPKEFTTVEELSDLFKHFKRTIPLKDTGEYCSIRSEWIVYLLKRLSYRVSWINVIPASSPFLTPQTPFPQHQWLSHQIPVVWFKGERWAFDMSLPNPILLKEWMKLVHSDDQLNINQGDSVSTFTPQQMEKSVIPPIRAVYLMDRIYNKASERIDSIWFSRLFPHLV